MIILTCKRDQNTVFPVDIDRYSMLTTRWWFCIEMTALNVADTVDLAIGPAVAQAFDDVVKSR